MGRSPCCPKEGVLKKGAWTPEEDQKLVDYIKEHGHGNWRALPKKCGLQRCGKSCRLRWTNYLRPDIKRGAFSSAEEQKIIQLHALVGNKWAFIASQLPKRTDNEIKNYWNTVLKKRLEPPKSNDVKATTVALPSPAAKSTAVNLTYNAMMNGLNYLPSPALVVDHLQNQHKMMKMMMMMSTTTKLKVSSAGGNADETAGKVWNCGSGIHRHQNSSTNTSITMASSLNHLAQWESARLEAEARLAQDSKSGGRTTMDWLFRGASTPANRNCSAAHSTNVDQAFAHLQHLPAGGLTASSRSTTTTTATTFLLHNRENHSSGTSSNAENGGDDNSSHCGIINTDNTTADLMILTAEHSSPVIGLVHSGSDAQDFATKSSNSNLPMGLVVKKAQSCSHSAGGDAAAAAMAIKLGANGRLSWNRHELTLPNLVGNVPPVLNFLQHCAAAVDDGSGINGFPTSAPPSNASSLLSSNAMDSILSSFNDIDVEIDPARVPHCAANERLKLDDDVGSDESGDGGDENSAGSMISFSMSSMLQDFYSSLQQSHHPQLAIEPNHESSTAGAKCGEDDGFGIMRSSSCSSNINQVMEVDICSSSSNTANHNQTNKVGSTGPSHQDVSGGDSVLFNSYVAAPQGQLNFQQLESLLGEASEAQFNNLLMDLNLC